MKLVRQSDGAVIAGELKLAASAWARMRGLMGRATLDAEEGLWLEPCASIHMMFMRFAIDVLFVRRLEKSRPGVGASGEVLRVCPQVRPWLGTAFAPAGSATWFGPAVAAVELPAGKAGQIGLREGDVVELESSA